jgi:hypothetical protein
MNSSETKTGYNFTIAPTSTPSAGVEYVHGEGQAGRSLRVPPTTTANRTTISTTPSSANSGRGRRGGSNAIDRVQIREDQSQGQFIRRFLLKAVVITTVENGDGSDDDGSGSKTVEVLCPTRASSIGNKYICVLPAPIQIASLTLEVTEAVGGTPRITQFAAFKCSELAAAIDGSTTDDG